MQHPFHRLQEADEYVKTIAHKIRARRDGLAQFHCPVVGLVMILPYGIAFGLRFARTHKFIPIRVHALQHHVISICEGILVKGDEIGGA